MAFDSTATTPSAGQHDPVGFEVALGRLSLVVDEAARSRRGSWLDRVRAGLVAFLGFLDDEPASGALLVEQPSFEEWLVGLRREQRVLGVLTGLLDEASAQAAAELPSESLTSELVAGGVLALVRERMRSGEGERLVELAPSLMAFIAVEYLGQGAASAALAVAGNSLPVEERSTPRTLLALDVPAGLTEKKEHSDLYGRRPSDLAMRMTHRTRLVLGAIARAPRSSNRRVAEIAGLSDEGHASRLLGRLQQRGLIHNVGAGAVQGEPNAWLLSAKGRRLLQLTSVMPRVGQPARGDAGRGGCVA